VKLPAGTWQRRRRTWVWNFERTEGGEERIRDLGSWGFFGFRGRFCCWVWDSGCVVVFP